MKDVKNAQITNVGIQVQNRDGSLTDLPVETKVVNGETVFESKTLISGLEGFALTGSFSEEITPRQEAVLGKV